MKRYLWLTVLFGFAGTPATAQQVKLELQAGILSLDADDSSVSITGASYGATLAVELPIEETFFIGAQASAQIARNEACGAVASPYVPQYCMSLGRDLSAGLRAGVNFVRGNSIYALADYTNQKVDASITSVSLNNHISRNMDGIRVGIGIRQSFSHRFYGKLEYSYASYEDGLFQHQGVAGIGYAF
jgi:opacity protein-like surface antigen